jgi:hypothetical protein
MTNLFEEYKKDFSLLIETGFVGIKQYDELSATRIFNAAQVISPKHTGPRIGMGYIQLSKLNTKKAIEIFDQVIKDDPNDSFGQVFAGIAYLLSKDHKEKGKKMIQEVISKTDDPTIKNLGETALSTVDKNEQKQSKIFGA